MTKAINSLLLFTLLVVLLGACKNDEKKQDSPQEKPAQTAAEKAFKAQFNADSAFAFVSKQCEFGPRVPNTEAHAACALWLEAKLKSYTPKVYVQKFKSRAYDGTILNGKNIIASFAPEKENRIILCAHWDSRHVADHDPNPENHRKAIDGANDGASGVGILIEIARQLQSIELKRGVDIILFDLEDYGAPADFDGESDHSWALGSQYWSETPHTPSYRAQFGILLDMVGAEDARFSMEGVSMYYAPDIMTKVWDIAHHLGHQSYFLKQHSTHITDDHTYINEIAGIPTIDIIHQDENSRTGFFKYWHTVKDNIDHISPVTLGVVGETVLTAAVTL